MGMGRPYVGNGRGFSSSSALATTTLACIAQQQLGAALQNIQYHSARASKFFSLTLMQGAERGLCVGTR